VLRNAISPPPYIASGQEHPAAELEAQARRAHPGRLTATGLTWNGQGLTTQSFDIPEESVKELHAHTQAQINVGLTVSDQDSRSRGELKAPQVQLSSAINCRLDKAALDPANVLGIAVKAGNEELRPNFDYRRPQGPNLDGIKAGGCWTESHPGTRFKRPPDTPDLFTVLPLNSIERAGDARADRDPIGDFHRNIHEAAQRRCMRITTETSSQVLTAEPDKEAQPRDRRTGRE
jgi:hypothetical protein